MSVYIDRANELRSCTQVHYNCAQSVFMAFCPEAGIDGETACRIAANFGSGMKCGSVCGAVTGGLMALGIFGVDAAPVIKDYYERVRAAFGESVNCAELLRKNTEAGGEKKSFCDRLVYECVRITEEILSEQGKI